MAGTLFEYDAEILGRGVESFAGQAIAAFRRRRARSPDLKEAPLRGRQGVVAPSLRGVAAAGGGQRRDAEQRRGNQSATHNNVTPMVARQTRTPCGARAGSPMLAT